MWATHLIEKPKAGESVTFRPKGNSMTPNVKSGQEVTCRPHDPAVTLKPGTVVLCFVGRSQYLHLVKAADTNRVLIGNNHGKINGWITIDKVYGVKV